MTAASYLVEPANKPVVSQVQNGMVRAASRPRSWGNSKDCRGPGRLPDLIERRGRHANGSAANDCARRDGGGFRAGSDYSRSGNFARASPILELYLHRQSAADPRGTGKAPGAGRQVPRHPHRYRHRDARTSRARPSGAAAARACGLRSRPCKRARPTSWSRPAIPAP